MRYKAYIWDYDGTLMDTYPHIVEAFRIAMEEAGTPIDPAEAAPYFYNNFGAARKHYGVPQDVWDAFRARHKGLTVRPVPEPFPDIPAVLRAITENGGINLLYTHSDGLAWKVLSLYGLDKYFAGRADSTMKFPAKPAPDAVQYLLSAYKTAPEDALMIGDRTIDVQAGLNAGIAGCLYLTHELIGSVDAQFCVNSMREFAEVMGIPLPPDPGPFLASVKAEAAEAALQLCTAAKLKAGQLVVVGCSSSEAAGEKIGTDSSLPVARAIFEGLTSVFAPRGIHIAAQCCEHLNRALVVEDGTTDSQRVNVIPMPKAGGAFATAAFRSFIRPAVVESVRADAGLDIGGTLIGMHLKRVAVPLRLARRTVGQAPLSAARTRVPFTGGVRAVYDEELL